MAVGAMFSDESVKHGQWFDYETKRTLWLLDNREVFFYHALVVFFAALCAKHVAIIVNRGLQLLGQMSGRAVFPQKPTDNSAGEQTPLVPPSPQRNKASSVSHSPLPFPCGGRDSTRNTVAYILNKDNPHKLWVFCCWIVLMVVLFGVTAFGVMAPSLITAGQSALWSSDVCGIWEFPTEDTTDEEATRRDVVLRKKEARAGEYAKYCYGSSNQPLPVYCNFFAHKSIPYDKTVTPRCPFNNITVCQGSDVVTFDTGKIPSSYLGINQKSPRLFRRTATCVPLNVNEPYVQESPGKSAPFFTYKYGTLVDTGEPLFDTMDNPFNWTAPTYDASVFTTGPGIDDYWTPIEDLKQPGNEALTLLFIRPLQIYYLKPSGDPLFPTDDHKDWGNGDRWYIKSDPKARVLACLDETELCDAKGETCWSAANHDDGILNDKGYWLMKLSVKDSTIYNSISLRLGTALVAQEMLSQQLSLGLSDDHWMTEAERLFATSLALSQLKAWSISSGEDSEVVGWEDQTPDEAKEAGGLCDLLKFKSTGYTDIDLERFWLLLILPYFLTGLLSTRWQTIVAVGSWLRRGSKGGREDESVPQTQELAQSNPTRSAGQQSSSNDDEEEDPQSSPAIANGKMQSPPLNNQRRPESSAGDAENGDADRLSRESTLRAIRNAKEAGTVDDPDNYLVVECIVYYFFRFVQHVSHLFRRPKAALSG